MIPQIKAPLKEGNAGIAVTFGINMPGPRRRAAQNSRGRGGFSGEFIHPIQTLGEEVGLGIELAVGIIFRNSSAASRHFSSFM